MKKTFSTSWKSSKQPRKQRKYLAKAPLHLKRKFLGANLSKDLKAKHKTRTISLRKGDLVKITRGKFKGKQGKVLEVSLKLGKIAVEGIQVKKMDGSKANVKLQPSNLKIIELNTEDKRRLEALSPEVSENKAKPLNPVSEDKSESKTKKDDSKEKN